MPRITFANKVTKWEVTINAIQSNSGDLAHLEEDRQKLQGLLGEVMELINQQMARQAASQQATRDLEVRLSEGEAVAARLRAGIRAKYGYKSEKLAEFQLRPFRRRTAKATTVKDSEASRS